MGWGYGTSEIVRYGRSDEGVRYAKVFVGADNFSYWQEKKLTTT